MLKAVSVSRSMGTLSRDLIGPPSLPSNIRPLRLHEPPNETPLQRKYRLRRQVVHLWNQRFWETHNRAFAKEREEFINENLPPNKLTLNADEMSIFYKNFLDKNWENHVNYNIQWYKKNISLVALSFQVSLEKLFNKMKS